MKFEEEFLKGQFFEFLILFMCLDGNQTLYSFIKAFHPLSSSLSPSFSICWAELSSEQKSK